tara:strand:- start:430 stop:885 length:456 start_codon:yes stop_codon:yes gene_type:complete
MISIKCSDNFCGVYTTEPITKNQVVHTLSLSETCEKPTRTSIQIKKGLHAEDEVGKYINHSCYPSCEIRGTRVIALKKIKPGQEITFDYNENEKVVASPFRCGCCDRNITGRGGRMGEGVITTLFVVAYIVFVLFMLLHSSTDNIIEPLGW